VLARLDDIDWKILRELQGDGRMTNVELARRVGISAPPCLRRVRALEEAGFIKGYRALLDGKALGFEVTAFAMVHLSSQAEADLTAFEEFVRAQPIVRECWMLSGEIDFVLKYVADTAQFEGCRDGAAGDAELTSRVRWWLLPPTRSAKPCDRNRQAPPPLRVRPRPSSHRRRRMP